jgi:hypothetical protein
MNGLIGVEPAFSAMTELAPASLSLPLNYAADDHMVLALHMV